MPQSWEPWSRITSQDFLCSEEMVATKISQLTSHRGQVITVSGKILRQRRNQKQVDALWRLSHLIYLLTTKERKKCPKDFTIFHLQIVLLLIPFSLSYKVKWAKRYHVISYHSVQCLCCVGDRNVMNFTLFSPADTLILSFWVCGHVVTLLVCF